jgi:3-oxoacyl-[acyl-carrier protein] reductase
VAQLTQSMAVEVDPRGVRVNTIAPGFVPTNMTARYCTRPDGTIDDDAKAAVLAPMATFCPLRRVGVPSDIGYCLLHVASVHIELRDRTTAEPQRGRGDALLSGS